MLARVPAAADFIRGAGAQEAENETVFGAGRDAARQHDEPRAGCLLTAIAVGSAAVQRDAGQRPILRRCGREERGRAADVRLLAIEADAHVGGKTLVRLVRERGRPVQKVDFATRRRMVAGDADVGELRRDVEQRIGGAPAGTHSPPGSIAGPRHELVPKVAVPLPERL